jgi:hypothetical protein
MKRKNQLDMLRRKILRLSGLFLLCPVVLSAQTGNGVTVSNLAVNAGTVTFNVHWEKPMPVALWSDSVWVFVDYNKAGKMERLPVTDATVSAGTVEKIPGNDKGVWVIGNARNTGSFSATVQLLTTINVVGGACAYASNYPPVGEYISATKISFTGTPMYEIALASGGGSETVTSGNTFFLPPSSTVTSFADATGAPGIMKCMSSVTYTLQASALAFCAGLVNVQFALSGTEDGRKYQLFRNNSAVGAVLNGTGNSATFTGSFNEAGAYTAQTVADDKYCATAMNGTRVVIENPLPVTISLTANPPAICSGDVVTLTAEASGAASYSFDDGTSWQTDSTKAVTPTLNMYYSLKTMSAAGCLSAENRSVAVSVTAVPATPMLTVTAPYNTPAIFTASGGSGSYEWLCDFCDGSSESTLTSPPEPGTYVAQVRSITQDVLYCYSDWSEPSTGIVYDLLPLGSPCTSASECEAEHCHCNVCAITTGGTCCGRGAYLNSPNCPNGWTLGCQPLGDDCTAQFVIRWPPENKFTDRYSYTDCGLLQMYQKDPGVSNVCTVILK